MSRICETNVGVSRAQGYKLVKRAWAQIHDDIEGPNLDRQEMLAWCVQTLLETAGQAKAQRNPGAVVAAIRQLDWMCGLGINSHAKQLEMFAGSGDAPPGSTFTRTN